MWGLYELLLIVGATWGGPVPQAALGAADGELSGNTVHPVEFPADVPDPDKPGGGAGAVATFSIVSQGSRSGNWVLKFGCEEGREDVDSEDDLAVDDDLVPNLFEEEFLRALSTAGADMV